MHVQESKGVHGAWLIAAVLLFGGVMLWGYLDQNHYFYHVKIAHIVGGSWGSHTAQRCDSRNSKSDQPTLECGAGETGGLQSVPVRFYGDTRLDLAPDSLKLHWTCRKSEEAEPFISCKIAPDK